MSDTILVDNKAPAGQFVIGVENFEDGNKHVHNEVYPDVGSARDAIEQMKERYGNCRLVVFDDRGQEVKIKS
jgi:hypothetical protein